jgi:hypothetical protein
MGKAKISKPGGVAERPLAMKKDVVSFKTVKIGDGM